MRHLCKAQVLADYGGEKGRTLLELITPKPCSLTGTYDCILYEEIHLTGARDEQKKAAEDVATESDAANFKSVRAAAGFTLTSAVPQSSGSGSTEAAVKVEPTQAEVVDEAEVERKRLAKLVAEFVKDFNGIQKDATALKKLEAACAEDELTHAGGAKATALVEKSYWVQIEKIGEAVEELERIQANIEEEAFWESEPALKKQKT